MSMENLKDPLIIFISIVDLFYILNHVKNKKQGLFKTSVQVFPVLIFLQIGGLD